MTSEAAAGAAPIVVAGEALHDLVPDGPGRFAAHAGGGPFNTARVLGRLGRPVAFLGRLSTDPLGEEHAALLAADRVGLRAVRRTEDPTTLAVVALDAAGVAAYRFYTEGTAAAGLEPADALDALPARAAILHVGTLGLVLEPLAAALEAVVERLAGTALVAVDPNCRPAALRDPAAYRARLGRVLARSDLVKVSEEDLAWLSPGTAPVAAARALLRDGAVALLTRGGDGCTVVTAGEAIEVAAPRVAVVDTIGAGDAFAGGFLAWWHRRGLGAAGLGDREALEAGARFACVVAARTCERAGASPPRAEELEAAGDW